MKLSEIILSYFGPSHNDSYDHMQYPTDDTSPCSMTDEEREASRYNRSEGETRSKNIMMQDLITELKQIGIIDLQRNKKKLQEIGLLHNLPIQYEKEIIDEG